MHFTKLFAFVPLLCLVVADGAAIQASFTEIQADSTDLNSKVSAYKGGLLSALGIVASSTKLLGSINDGTKTAKQSANLTDAEALALAGSTQSLAANVNQTLTTIISKKKVFQQNLLQPAILLNLQIEKKATDEFSAAVLEKVPVALRPIAQSLIQPIDTAFQEAIADYSSL